MRDLTGLVKEIRQWTFMKAPIVDEVVDIIEALKEPPPEAYLMGARSIGETMGEENHVVRARKCYEAIVSAVLEKDDKR
jgi:hypothetical protein